MKSLAWSGADSDMSGLEQASVMQGLNSMACSTVAASFVICCGTTVNASSFLKAGRAAGGSLGRIINCNSEVNYSQGDRIHRAAFT